MKALRRIVVLAALLLFLVWLIPNLGRITAGQEGLIRFTLGSLLAFIVLFRWKPRAARILAWPRWFVPACGVAGVIGAIFGIVFRVHQFEWLGLLLLIFACLAWAMPPRYRPDLGLAMVLLYWIHPLPGQIFGSFQLAMQYLSVKGAEWLLHCVNVRVWADGFIMHALEGTFGVPESCSGMRTIVTVLICTLGVGILFRLKWHEIVAFLVLGVFQVLILNIARIVFMVLAAPRMPPGWGETFLHDSSGLFLLASLLLLQGEASWWKVSSSRRRRRLEGIESGELEHPERASTMPHIWRMLLRWGAVALLALLVMGLIAGVVYKRRPAHRAAMIRDLVEDLVHTNLETAEKGVAAALRFTPDDRGLLSLRARILVLRGKLDEGLKAYNALPGDLSPWEKLLKSWALMSLGRAEESIALLRDLPPALSRNPSVEMIRAEYAAHEKDINGLVQHIVPASRSAQMIPQVRRLLPILAVYEQWSVIAACYSGMPYSTPDEVLIDIQAFLMLDDMENVANSLALGLEKWPGEPRFLASLYALASAHAGGDWELRFARNFAENVAYLSADQLAEYIPFCFGLYRPDLAWSAYLRLRQLDPRDPSLQLLAARYGPRWLLVRSHNAHIEAAGERAATDLTAVYAQTRSLPLFHGFWVRIPLVPEILRGTPDEISRRYLRDGLAELERRSVDGGLSRRMLLNYASALAAAGRYDEARARLAQLLEEHPEAERLVMLQNARIYDFEGKAEHAYEILVRYRESATGMPGLQSSMLLVDAMMKLDLGVAAMALVHDMHKVISAARRPRVAEAAIWATFGYVEQALFLTRGVKSGWTPATEARLLYRTGRYREADRIARGERLRLQRDPEREQPVRILQAEVSLKKRWPAPLSVEEMREGATRAEKAERDRHSPFLAGLIRRTAAWLRAEGGAGTSDHRAWEEIGRNEFEKGSALHRLTMLLAQQKQYGPAASATRRALEFLPSSAILWRILIALEDGDSQVVEAAYEACPRDPEIWLAWLVTRIKQDKDDKAVSESVKTAAKEHRYSVGATVRAADFLLRAGMVEQAGMLARDAESRCRGYVPAYLVALRCAAGVRDSKWAIDAAVGGIEHAVDPTPFYKALVAVKGELGQDDADLTGALEFLRQRFPEQTVWPERLGSLYFDKQDPRRTLSILEPLLAKNGEDVRAGSWLLAAEAARIDGQDARAVRFLEAARAVHPDKLEVLNNLVYNLAQDPKTLPRAREMLPALLQQANESYAVLDTVAVVYLRSGDLHKAYEFSKRAIEKVKEDDYLSAEVHLNAAEILLRMGRFEEAREKLESVRRTAKRPVHVDLAARELLLEARKKQEERRANPN